MVNYERVPGDNGFLGGGTFGRVDKVRRKCDQKVRDNSFLTYTTTEYALTPFFEILACKTVMHDGTSRSELLAKRERLDHPTIVRYFDTQWESRQVQLYMDFCKEKGLDRLIRDFARSLTADFPISIRRRLRYSHGNLFKEDYIRSIIYQSLNALARCYYGKWLPGNRGDE